MTKVVPTPDIKPTDGASAITDETTHGVEPHILGPPYASPIAARLSDVLQLFKLRVTAMVVLTGAAGYFLAARHAGYSFFSFRLLATLFGIGVVSAGAAALNQVLERDADARMSRTKDRPIPAGRLSPLTATAIGIAAVLIGAATLAFATNWLTAGLALITAFTYVLVYTPLKKIGPISTFVGAFPGAMPAVLGWTAVDGVLRWEALALFAIIFVWQFPHFLAIAWLYREDYELAGIRMLPVLDVTGRATIRQILFFSVLLIPVSLTPFFMGMAGWLYLVGSIILGTAYLIFGIRLALLRLPPSVANSKKEARELLQASIAYLPLLFGLLMLNGGTG